MRRFILIVVAFWLAVLQVEAASNAETRAFTAAVNAFRTGIWERAEKELAAFVDKYPASTNVPEAVLLRAEARLKLGRLSEAAGLLSANLNKAGELADEYLYWLGQIQFQGGKFSEAANDFGRLAREFPKSARRLEAALGEAASLSKSKPEQWLRVVGLLSDPNGAFQSAASLSPASESAYRGHLLLAEAQLTLKDFHATEATLMTLTNWQPSAELNWQRQNLLCRVQRADGRADEALRSAKELLALAGVSKSRPESIEMEAGILEQLNRADDAIAAYQENLGDDIPVERQQQALFKIAELSMSLGKWDDATQKLKKFLEQNTNSPVADMVLFTLGDLQLKQYLAVRETNQPADAINFLRAATVQFQMLVDKYPGSGLAGRALLNKGWSLWLGGDVTNSLTAFQTAARRLPVSKDQLVARFKWADAQSRLKNFPGAITNYNFVVNTALNSPQSQGDELVEPALYQLLRASLDANDLKSANGALTKILDLYPNGFITPGSLLLVGQGFALRQDTIQARAKFVDFEKRFPSSSLLPELRLAMARTYEQDQNWTNAIGQYDDWLATFTNNPAAVPQAEFYRAWANYQAGNETNALTLFTNLVARFPTSEFAAQAQMWVADHYFRQSDFVNAEIYYQGLYQKWPASDLGYQARMMAGRAAVARLGYSDAIGYFTNLASNPNCPADLRAQATFAYGDTLMSMDANDSNRVANLAEAVRVFKNIPSTNQLFIPASGRIGDCYLQWSAIDARQYVNATNAYEQLLNSPLADVAARSRAKVGLAVVSEKLAQGKSGADGEALLQQAFNYYFDVFGGNILREGETLDPFWTKKATLEAERLSESLNEWLRAKKLYQQLGDLIPALRPALEKKIEKIVREHPEAGLN